MLSLSLLPLPFDHQKGGREGLAEEEERGRGGEESRLLGYKSPPTR